MHPGYWENLNDNKYLLLYELDISYKY